MTLQRELFEETYRVRLRPKSKLWWARAIGELSPSFMTSFWTTVRFPGQPPVIAYPTTVKEPLETRYHGILKHELVHVNQMRTSWGLIKTTALYFFLPLPILFSGRWYVERPAYLLDIDTGRKSIDGATELLWRSYVVPWPRPLMRRWFKKHAKTQMEK